MESQSPRLPGADRRGVGVEGPRNRPRGTACHPEGLCKGQGRHSPPIICFSW